MNYLPMMTEEEIKYVCSVMPLSESVRYFKRYPKDFAKVLRGFRASSLRNQEHVSSLLFRSRNQPFISSFIEKHISDWIKEIQQEISLVVDKGESKEIAWLQTLPLCFFADDIGIFFRLTGEEQSEEYISLLSKSIKMIKDLDVEGKKLNKMLNDKEHEQVRLEDEVKSVYIELESSEKQLIELSGEIKTLKRTNAGLEKLAGVVRVKENDIEGLEKKVQERDVIIKQLKVELSAVLNEQQQFETRIREEVEKQKTAKLIEKAASVKPRCPKDLDEFRDYLGFNLENLGIEIGVDYYSLLKDYLCEILFTGKPILVSRHTGLSLIKCISNALISSVNVATLTFDPNISVEGIDEFLSAKNRILCLDNFVGNFNETILITTCDRHKDKIVFLTVPYDRTLQYVPDEFLKYCHYLNLNRIKAFAQVRDLTEDPSSVEEIEAPSSMIIPDTFWASLLKEILSEIGIGCGLSTYKSSLIFDELNLCRLLAFDILPFCTDVLDISPFVVSERLNKYAGNSGRCPCKELFERWFS